MQRGCDYRCTYCIVPYTRGPERSRQLADVVRETREVAAQGLTEVVLLGQTVNSYTDGTHDFADLLRAVGAVAGIRRVRFTSPHPNDFSDRVIAAMAETPTVCEHVHLPMQSGSSRTLKRMLRRYTREEYLACVARLRAADSRARAHDRHHRRLPRRDRRGVRRDALRRARDRLRRRVHVQVLDARRHAGRRGSRRSCSFADDVIDARFERLKDAVRGIARERNMKRLGERREVLIEKEARKGGDLLQARSRDFKTVIVPGDPSMIGSYCTVELTGTTGSTFTGTPVAERAPLPLAG